MTRFFISLSFFWILSSSQATTHIVYVWDGYYQFLEKDITISFGDTVEWLPLGGGAPTMVHTITSTNIPVGATPFDQIWQAPADTFFRYVPTQVGYYEYQCTPHADPPLNMVGSITVEAPLHTPLNKQMELGIYPNPAFDFVYISGLNQETAYSIHSTKGALIQEGVTAGKIEFELIPSGIYFLVLINEQKNTFRIVKE